LAQAAPFTLDKAGKGRGEEKSAANGHEIQGVKGI
jgi:hypothetical protein